MFVCFEIKLLLLLYLYSLQLCCIFKSWVHNYGSMLPDTMMCIISCMWVEFYIALYGVDKLCQIFVCIASCRNLICLLNCGFILRATRKLWPQIVASGHNLCDWETFLLTSESRSMWLRLRYVFLISHYCPVLYLSFVYITLPVFCIFQPTLKASTMNMGTVIG